MTGKEADIMTIEKILEIISDREKPVHHIRDKKYKEDNLMGYLLFITGGVLVMLEKLGVIPDIEYANMVGQTVNTLEAAYTIAIFIQIMGIILIIIRLKKRFEYRN